MKLLYLHCPQVEHTQQNSTRKSNALSQFRRAIPRRRTRVVRPVIPILKQNEKLIMIRVTDNGKLFKESTWDSNDAGTKKKSEALGALTTRTSHKQNAQLVAVANNRRLVV